MKLKRLFVILCLAFVFFTLAGCAKASADKVRISQKELLTLAEVGDKSIYLSREKRENMKKVAVSGVLEMYFDEKTTAVCIYDTLSGVLYRSLPYNASGLVTSNLSLHIIVSGEEYTLSSQRDSLAGGCSEFEYTDRGVTVSYSFRYSLDKNHKLSVTVPVSYTLSDGAFTAGVNCDEITDDSSCQLTIKALELLPFFASDNQADPGDYILLPDGIGALIDLGEKTGEQTELSLPVYGEGELRAMLPAFGRKKGQGAYICLIKQGDALCDIRASKAGSQGLNTVGVCCEITPTVVDDRYYYISRESYKGTLELCYRFLNGEAADYVSMAAALRELLIRQGDLTEGSVTNNKQYPFNLSLVMTRQTPLSDSKQALQTLTTYSEAQELLSSMRAKGFEKINLHLEGVFGSDLEPQKALGGERAWEDFCAYALDEGISLYADTRLLSASDKKALSLTGEKTSPTVTEALEDKIALFLYQTRKSTVTGFALCDAAAELKADYSGDISLKTDVRNSLRDLVNSISASRSLMIDTGNLYAIKYADCVINIPDSSFAEKYGFCRQVPFMAILLHGICDYSLTPANLQPEPRLAMLTAVEYGAIPCYRWYCSELSTEEKADMLNYNQSLSQARLHYDSVKTAFSQLRSQRITEHYILSSGLSVTQYSDGTKVYVNKGKKAKNVGAVTVDALSFKVVGDTAMQNIS